MERLWLAAPLRQAKVVLQINKKDSHFPGVVGGWAT